MNAFDCDGSEVLSWVLQSKTIFASTSPREKFSLGWFKGLEAASKSWKKTNIRRNVGVLEPKVV